MYIHTSFSIFFPFLLFKFRNRWKKQKGKKGGGREEGVGEKGSEWGTKEGREGGRDWRTNNGSKQRNKDNFKLTETQNLNINKMYDEFTYNNKIKLNKELNYNSQKVE